MAIDINNARFLIALKRNGINFSNTATVGRQGLFIPTRLIPEIFAEGGVLPSKQINFGTAEFVDFSEPFFQQLGCDDLATIDYSDYEGATVIQDMNKPVPDSLKNRFGVLIDSGSIEHMFNVPQAIFNYMQMVKNDGYLVLVNMPVNNHAGHGFYQFSPELFFNLLTPENGFEVKTLMLAADAPFSKFYSVTRPEVAKSRIELFGNESVMLFVVAKKIKNVDSLTIPVQHDYAVAWKGNTASAAVTQAPSLKQRITSAAKNLSLRKYFTYSLARNEKVLRKRFSFENRSLYSPVDIETWKSD